MSGFSAAWLGLREPADHAARSSALSTAVAEHLSIIGGEVAPARPLRVVDLATGTGSNPRYLSRYFPAYQDWTLLDADLQLLNELPVRIAAWATRIGSACALGGDGVVVSTASTQLRIRPRRADLSRFPIAAFAERPALVTASALLDLVSAQWLTSLVSACREIDAAVLFALTYDGRTTISPSLPDDQLVLELVNRHQVGDKGFGQALGPGATTTAAEYFAQAGYDVRREPSDWIIGPSERRLQQELIAGWASAASEMQPGDRDRIRAWASSRDAAALAGELTIVVGHEDLAAWPHS